MTIFKGLSAFPITPLDESGHIDVAGLSQILERIIDNGADSIGLLGSTGSCAYLTAEQRRIAVETAHHIVRGRLPLIIGVGALTTTDALMQAKQAVILGADGLLLAPMSYLPLLDHEVAEHFETIASDVDRPLCIYNNPGTTHFDFSLDLIRRLAIHPNIQAIKTPAKPSDEIARQHAELIEAAGDSLSVGYSVDANACNALVAGGNAWYSVMTGVFPAACAVIAGAVRADDPQAARTANSRLQPLWDICAKYSSYRVAHECVAIIGLARPVMPRPILPLSSAAREELRDVLRQCELS